MKQTIITSLIIGLLALLGGYYLGQTKLIPAQNFNNNLSNQPIKTNTTPENNVKINSLSGTVKEISGNTIILKIDESDERTVETDGNTKIYILEEKSPEQYQKEMTEYTAKLKAQADGQREIKPGQVSDSLVAPVLSPEAFARKDGSLADIKTGAIITVVANQNIKDTKQFKVTEIFILPALTVPSVVPAI